MRDEGWPRVDWERPNGYLPAAFFPLFFPAGLPGLVDLAAFFPLWFLLDGFALTTLWVVCVVIAGRAVLVAFGAGPALAAITEPVIKKATAIIDAISFFTFSSLLPCANSSRFPEGLRYDLLVLRCESRLYNGFIRLEVPYGG
jgi:hypothetical protein